MLLSEILKLAKKKLFCYMTFSYASCVFSIRRNLFCFRYSCNTSFLWLFVILSVGSSIRCSDFMGDVQVVCSCLQIALWGPLFFFWSSFVTKCRSCVKFWAVKCCPVNSNWQNTMLYFGKSCWHRISISSEYRVFSVQLFLQFRLVRL